MRAATIFLALGLVLIATPAEACTLCSCTASTSAVSFGTYDPVSASARDATGAVQVDCTGVVSLLGTVDIRASAGGSGNFLQRRLSRSGATLNYNLYADATRTRIFGDGSSGTSTLSAPLNGLLFFSTSVPVYGRLPAGQWVASGTYTDTVVITVVY